MGDTAVSHVDVGCENVPKLQSDVNNLCTDAKVDIDNHDETLDINKKGFVANEVAISSEVSDASCNINSRIPEDDLTSNRLSASTEIVDNGDLLQAASKSSSCSEKVNEDSSDTSSQNGSVDKTNESQTASEVLQMKTDVPDVKEDVTPKELEVVTEMNTDTLKSQVNSDESEVVQTCISEDVVSQHHIKDLCESKNDGCIEMEVSNEEHLCKNSSVEVVQSDNSLEYLLSRESNVNADKTSDIKEVAANNISTENLLSEESNDKADKNSDVREVASNNNSTESLLSEESNVKEDENYGIGDTVDNDTSMNCLPLEESYVKEEKNSGIGDAVPDDKSVNCLLLEESHAKEDENSGIGDAVLNDNSVECLSPVEHHAKEDQNSGIGDAVPDKYSTCCLSLEESHAKENRNSGIGDTVLNDNSVECLSPVDSHVQEDKNYNIGDTVPKDNSAKDLPSEKNCVQQYETSSLGVKPDGNCMKDTTDHEGTETKVPSEISMCVTKGESLGGDLVSDPQNSKANGTSSEMLHIEEDQYIVVDEDDSCAVDTSDEASPRKKPSSSPGNIKGTSPIKQEEKIMDKPGISVKKPKNLVDNIAEDAEAIEEEIDSWLTGITSDDSEKSDDDSEVIDKTLKIICEEEEEENRKLSDSEEINSVLKEMCQEENTKLSDSEAIDSVLKDICNEEEQTLSQEVNKAIGDICREENEDDDKLSSTDEGSIKDGIDIESVIEAICDDEDEICSRVDSIRKNKSEEDEDMDDSDDEEEEEDELSDSEAIVAVVDAISEEDGDNLISNAIEDGKGISGQLKGSNKLSPDKKGTKENLRSVETQVKSVISSLCNVVELQYEQMIQSHKIAKMESVLHDNEPAKHKEAISNCRNSSSINKSVPSEKQEEKQRDCSSYDEIKKVAVRKRQSNLVDEESSVKKPRLECELESEGDDGMECDDVSSELNSVSGKQLKDHPEQISGEILVKPSEISVKNDVKDKSGDDSCDEGENLETLDSVSSAEEFINVDSHLKKKTNSDDTTKDKNVLVTKNIETCTNGVKFDTTNPPGDIVCLPSPQVLSVAGQIGNENSSDSDKSFCKTLKIEENLQDIIKSLSSPKHECSDMEVDSSVASATDISKNEKDAVKEEVTAKVEFTDTEDIKPKLEPKLESKKEIFIPKGLFTHVEHKPVSKGVGEASEIKCKIEVKDNIEMKIDIKSVADVKPAVETNLPNGNCSAVEKSRRTPPNDENSFLEIAESDVGRFVRGRIREYYVKTHSEVKYLQNQIEKLKTNLEEQRKYTEGVRIQMRELATQQSTAFRQYGYNPKVEKRTVGVNVRIVQQQQPLKENKLKTYSNSPKNISNASQPTSPKVAASIASTKSSPGKPSALTTVNTSPVQPGKSVQASMPVQLLVTSSTSLNNSTVSVTPAQSTGSRVSTSSANVSLPLTTSVVLLTSSSVTTSAGHQVVDLTDDNDSSSARRHAAMSNVQLRAATPVRGQLPSKANTPQNLVPLPMMTSLPSMVQLLPTGTTVSSTVTDVNTIRMVRSSAGLPQTTRLAYFVPNSSGALPVIHQIGGTPPRLAVNVSPQQSAIIPNMRQPLQTFVLTPMRKFQSSLVPVISTNSQGAVATQARAVTPSAKMVAATTTTTAALGSTSQLTLTPCFNKHPAPLPPSQMYPPNPKLKALPPKPSLKMSKVATGIVLSWNMSLTNKHANIATYQLYAYQENKGPVGHHLWKKVGDINALPLPMACTLTQFVEGHKYHFTVRAVDVHKRSGPFSEPASILLINKSQPGESGSSKSSQ